MSRLAYLAQLGSPAPSIPNALRGGGFVCAEVDVGTFWLPIEDEVTRPFLQRERTWERPTADLIRRLIRPGCRFLDVGAGVGYYSVLAGGHGPRASIDCVEPNPATLDLLKLNLWLNGVNARVWEVALAAERTALPLRTTSASIGEASVSSFRTDEVYPVVVPAVTADELFPRSTFDLVKIDVQGSELDVLLGMQRIVRSSAGISIVVEYTPGRLRNSGRDPQETLASYRRLGLDIVMESAGALARATDKEILDICDSAGPTGQIHLLLTRR